MYENELLWKTTLIHPTKMVLKIYCMYAKKYYLYRRCFLMVASPGFCLMHHLSEEPHFL